MTIPEIISQMTLEEKAALLTGEDSWHIRNCPRLGMERTMVSDGPHGLRKEREDANGGLFKDSIDAVCFPSAVGMASSFHPDALAKLGETLGEECQAEDVSILLGPGVNMKRSPLCGRNFEYFSEDPYLTGKLAASYVRGVQSKGVGTSVKHFAANNQEYRRMSISAVVDERALREIYLAAFEMVVKEAKPWTLMCSYNRINGVYSSENEWLLNRVLRKEWGFEGFVMTDWGASNYRVLGVGSGCDLEMPSSGERNTQRIIRAVRSGKLHESRLDLCVRRILEASQRYLDGKRSAIFDREQDHEIARELAREAMVLLKNENNVLPLKEGAKVAFLGEFAKQPRYQGGGSSHIHAHRVTSAWEAAQGKAQLTFAPGYLLDNEEVDTALLRQAAQTAKDADVAVVFIGLTDRMESEGYDRKHLNLPNSHNELVKAVAKVQKNTVVVLHNGSPVLMPWLGDVQGVLEAYLGGEAAGEAVADLLFGEANPSGKLPETFPLSLEDTPCAAYFPGNQLTVEYRESIYIGYRYYDKADKDVLFPFGFGLSYTQFAYSGLKLSRKKLGEGDTLVVSFRVKNTGAVAGAEAAQLYVAAPVEHGFRAPQELKGFQKVFLEPGDEQEITITLDERAFSYYNVQKRAWEPASGTYEIRIGASSRDIRLKQRVEVSGDAFPNFEQYPSYISGMVQKVPDGEFEALLGQPMPKAQMEPGERFTINNCLEDAKDSLENLEKYNEQLQALDGKTPGTETVVLIQDLDDKNEKAYEILKDLTEDPAGYIAEKAAARGEGDEVWADDWAADIQVVKWLKENDGKRLYKENQAYILKILAFQEK